ncbi:ABC-type nitrate/sulfonate/bicarbonate transporter protein [Calothrix parasitica NIES-267]|uniref:ABC-type nitrate/sulfonate/bicarbonate transporter protein n=1 Tax=Calothrix parasitica NIES-267 TaxID=1973488 RepID=A0A1Z4LRZ7_9CYAN|nr:ABC-type nitrate/sulfonate/bicarbonate transporter protein [Calothrix parasitica NIES-267]
MKICSYKFKKFIPVIITKIINNFIISLFLGTLLTSTLVGCIKKPPDPLLVGYIVWPGYESLYLARDLGYYKDTPIRLVDYPSNSEVIRAFRNRNLQAAALTLYEALLVAETEPSVRVVLILDSSNGADAILAKPEINTLEAIKGKRVGVESGALGGFILTRALEKVNLKPKDVQIVSLGLSEHKQAFKRKKVDAVVTSEPTGSKLLADGANLLFDSSEIPGEILDVLVVREELLRTQYNATQALLDGYFSALNYLKENPQDAARRIAPREGVTPQQFLKSLEGLVIHDLQENKQILGKTDTLSREKVNKVAQFMLTNKLLNKQVEPTYFFDDSIVKKVNIQTEKL